MIFVIVGSQKFPFDRLIREMDRLAGEGILRDGVEAQIGACTYEPKHMKWQRFLDKSDFDAAIENCDLLVTHAGEGAIMTGLLKGKPVIAVPRYRKFGEHVSDHQLEIARALAKQRCIVNVEDISRPENAILSIGRAGLVPYESGSDSIIRLLRDFIGD
ncbi:MAG: beta(1,3)galactosyltransferase EpsH [Clostridia bacterium]|nr:beta(1,3)galactosyltransferase EpsH [Clostridia bacterium]